MSLSALMEFLRLLCENHYREIQDYMRTQPDNLRSYNVVGGVMPCLPFSLACISGRARLRPATRDTSTRCGVFASL